SPACAVVFLASSRFRRDPPSFPTRRSSDLRANSNAFEINCENGSIAFDMERLNELEVADKQGFKRLLVTEPGHPFMRFWWPHGHIIGWGETFVHEVAHLLEAIAGEHPVAPHGATFEDG